MATSSFVSPVCSLGSRLLVKTSLHQKKRSRLVVSARKEDGGGQHYGGRLVDENMATLRRRIHEMKVVENNYEAPREWMEWERRYHARYGSDVSELMGALQVFLLNARPGVGLAAMAMLALSMPASVILILMSRSF
ncbi:uncharacterized protein LOC135625772 [Musa acuminata AAA Group]|uniref:uncharacterized protein LOC135625772 n=1 Tax=Musa acuminata AAA Group TaxID=214697 RepID=UPI0031CEB455